MSLFSSFTSSSSPLPGASVLAATAATGTDARPATRGRITTDVPPAPAPSPVPPVPPGPPVTLRHVLLVSAWTLACLVAFDVAINVAFRHPSDPARRASSLQQYFEYGRSIEGKLRRMIGPTGRQSHPLAVAGWVDRVPREARRPALAAGQVGLAVYGMSFSNHVAEAMHDADPAFVPTLYAAPSAPPSHSYACFLKAHADRADDNPVQVLGVLASSVKGLLTLGGATRSFEAPNPYTFPRYTLGPDGQLAELRPVIGSVEDLRAALADDARWAAHVEQLARHDRFYDPLLMGGAAADRSALVRMARRGYAQHASRAVAAGGGDGFGDDPAVGPVLRAIVRDFARRSRAANRVPLVLLIHDRGYRDELHRLLAPALEADGVPYVSTHDVAPTSDPSNFIGDGHFTRDANRRIGQRAATVLKSHLESQQRPVPSPRTREEG